MPYIYVDKEQYDKLPTVSKIMQYVFPRVTEQVSVLDCEIKATFHPVHTGEMEWVDMSTYVSLAGTLGHHKIENFCRETIDLQPVPLDLTAGDRILYDEIMNDPDALEWINAKIDHAWDNFQKFWYDFKPKVLVPEQTMVYVHRENGRIIEKKSLKGTVDLICEIDPDIMTEKALKMFPIGDKMTVMLDWKTGKAKQLTHHAQLEAYHWMLEVTGKWDTMIDQGIVKYPFAHVVNETGRSYPVALCVLLGGKYYKAICYDMTEGLFQEAREIFLNPRPIVLDRSTWDKDKQVYREGYKCVFCVHRDTVCPIYRMVVTRVNLE